MTQKCRTHCVSKTECMSHSIWSELTKNRSNADMVHIILTGFMCDAKMQMTLDYRTLASAVEQKWFFCGFRCFIWPTHISSNWKVMRISSSQQKIHYSMNEKWKTLLCDQPMRSPNGGHVPTILLNILIGLAKLWNDWAISLEITAFYRLSKMTAITDSDFMVRHFRLSVASTMLVGQVFTKFTILCKIVSKLKSNVCYTKWWGFRRNALLMLFTPWRWQ
jgi:hypothetical protein